MVETPVSLGEEIILKIQGMTHQGWGIGRYRGFTVFVPGTLPGEEVEVKISGRKKSFAVGDLIRITGPVPDRIAPRCAVYDACGGCQVQYARYQRQLELKESLVRESLTRIGKLSGVKVQPVLGMDDPWGYRNRAQFHVQVQKDRVKLGFFRPGTRDLVPMEECHLLSSELNEVARWLRNELEKLAETGDLSSLKHIVLQVSRAVGEMAAVFVTSVRELSFLGPLAGSLNKTFPRVVSVMQNVNRQNTGSVFGPEWRLILGRERIEEKIAGLVFSAGPGSFIQVNPEQTQVLYGKVLEYAGLKGSEMVIDVYCGIGAMSLLLAQKAALVYGIEEFKGAVRDAELNARLNGMGNVRFSPGKAEDLLPEMHASGIQPDLVVVDPPRKGCEPAVLDAIAGMNPARVIYVSCDPATLARDLKMLSEKGYRVQEVQPVDMFPQTGHVETIILMTNSGSKGK